MQIFHIVPAPLLELHHLKISAKIANHGDVWRWGTLGCMKNLPKCSQGTQVARSSQTLQYISVDPQGLPRISV